MLDKTELEMLIQSILEQQRSPSGHNVADALLSIGEALDRIANQFELYNQERRKI